MTPLLIDTDLGTDPDDLQVLMIAGRLGLDVVGVTTVYGDTDLRARMAATVAPMVGLDCPVVAGERETMSGRDVLWAGFEGDGVPGIETARYRDDVTAPEFIAEVAAAHAGRLDVLAIGPLTNLASVLLADPTVAVRIRHLYVMGGDFSGDPTAGPEHNVSADPLASSVVLASGIPTTITGFDQTRRVVLGDEDEARIAAAGPAGALLVAQTRRFVELISQLGLPGFGRGHIPHDPIALLTRERPELFGLERCRIDVVGSGDDAGRVRAVADPSAATRVLRDLDPDVVRAVVVDLLVGR